MLLIDRGFKLSFESSKNEKLALFKHGDRAYDHIIIFPTKSKGNTDISMRFEGDPNR